MTALSPRLTRLDERVLTQLLKDHGVRAEAIARMVYRPGFRRAPTTGDERRELAEILRGLEHRLVVQAGGWWRRAS